MDNFRWTDELVQKFAEEYRFSSSRISIEQFKQSKQPKKDYEILSYRNPFIITDVESGDIEPPTSAAIFRNYPIHSVRRLSDGEVFTVGDKVCETVTGGKDNWIIKEFSNKDTRCFSCGVNIMNLEKVKTPLFTTEQKSEIIQIIKEYYENKG